MFDRAAMLLGYRLPSVVRVVLYIIWLCIFVATMVGANSAGQAWANQWLAELGVGATLPSFGVLISIMMLSMVLLVVHAELMKRRAELLQAGGRKPGE